MALDQEGFRWRNDDGAEGAGSPEGASWKAAQDTNITLALDTPARLRVLVNHASGAAPGASKYRLEYRRVESPTPSWSEVEPRGSPDSTGRVRLALSSNITAGGADTTAILLAPAGSPKSFTAGRIWDDESGQDSITIGADQYTELEFCIEAVSANGAQASDVYEFRVTRAFAGTTDPSFANVELLLVNESGKSDGNTSFSDQSSNGFAITVSGQAQWDTGVTPPSAQTAWGLFDGSDYLRVEHNEALCIGAGDFTIEIFCQTTDSDFGTLVTHGEDSSDASWQLYKLANESLRFWSSTVGNVGDITDTQILTMTPGTVYYIYVKRSGTTLSAGYGTTPGGATTEAFSLTRAQTFFGQGSPSAGPLILGSHRANPAEGFNGNIGGFRLTIGVARDTSVVPTLPFPNQ